MWEHILCTPVADEGLCAGVQLQTSLVPEALSPATSQKVCLAALATCKGARKQAKPKSGLCGCLHRTGRLYRAYVWVLAVTACLWSPELCILC